MCATYQKHTNMQPATKGPYTAPTGSAVNVQYSHKYYAIRPGIP